MHEKRKEYDGLIIPQGTYRNTVTIKQMSYCVKASELDGCAGLPCRECLFFVANLKTFEKWDKGRG